MNIYIGFTLSPKRYAISRLVAVLNYLSGRKVELITYFLPKKDQPIQMAYIMIIVIITPIVIYLISLSIVSLASPLSAKCSIMR